MDFCFARTIGKHCFILKVQRRRTQVPHTVILSLPTVRIPRAVWRTVSISATQYQRAVSLGIRIHVFLLLDVYFVRSRVQYLQQLGVCSSAPWGLFRVLRHVPVSGSPWCLRVILRCVGTINTRRGYHCLFKMRLTDRDAPRLRATQLLHRWKTVTVVLYKNVL